MVEELVLYYLIKAIKKGAMNLFRLVVAYLLLSSSCFSYASLVTYGNISLENIDDVFVTDTNRGIDYLRWNQISSMSYAELTQALDVGGLYEGWRIGQTQDARNFIDGLVPTPVPNQCNERNNFRYTCRNTDYPLFRTLMGTLDEKYLNGSSTYFLSDGSAGFGKEVGYILHEKYQSPEFISMYAGVIDLVSTDKQKYVGFMLVRDSASMVVEPVSEPSMPIIFAIGMIVLGYHRFKKQF